jgi:hypothetical protein
MPSGGGRSGDAATTSDSQAKAAYAERTARCFSALYMLESTTSNIHVLPERIRMHALVDKASDTEGEGALQRPELECNHASAKSEGYFNENNNQYIGYYESTRMRI